MSAILGGGKIIISASRRTDIPAHYADWFMNRIRDGVCMVPNAFNPSQVSRVSLAPEHVDAIVFWTRDAGPMLEHLAELDARGYRYLVQYTVVDNGLLLEPGAPALRSALKTLRRLADRVGPDKICWRYDPIVPSNRTPPAHHTRQFGAIASALKGACRRCVISIVDIYPAFRRRLAAHAGRGFRLLDCTDTLLEEMIPAMAQAAAKNGMQIRSCAEPLDLARLGVAPGKCIDDEWIRDAFGLSVPGRKDPAQRKACGCVVSRDIGIYGTCPSGCLYCYAARNAPPPRHDIRASGLTVRESK